MTLAHASRNHRPRCLRCLRQLAYTRTGLVFVERIIGGVSFKFHLACAKAHDKEGAADKPVTAAVRDSGEYCE